MNQSYFLKNTPAVLQPFIRPMLAISVGMHFLLLMLPLPSETKTELVKKEEKVKITQLPTSSTPPILKASPKPVLSPSSKPVAPPPPRTAAPPIRQAAPVRQAAPIRQAAPLVAKAPSQPTPSPSQQKQSSTPSASATPTPTATETPTSAEVATPSPSASATPVDPFADFPKYGNAEPGSLGLFQGDLDKASQQTKDELSPVATYFQKELATRNYQVQSDVDEANKKVLVVSKNGLTKYLNLFFKSGQGTVMILASDRLDPGNLGDVGVASAEENAFYGVLGQMSSEVLDSPELFFNNPNAFYAKLGQDEKGFDIAEPMPGIDGSFKLVPNQTPEQVFTNNFANSLQTSGFQVTPTNSYGGGGVYEVKQGSFIRYINLVPTKDATGTVVVVWSQLPS